MMGNKRILKLFQQFNQASYFLGTPLDHIGLGSFVNLQIPPENLASNLQLLHDDSRNNFISLTD